MADNGLEDRKLIGLAFDGTGYGSDGAFWGGEVLLASYSDFDRFAHLEYLPLPGGDTAIRSPWQIACGYAHALGLEIDDLPFLQQVDKHVHENLIKKTDEAPNPSFGSSMLCLMEAVAGLIGIRRDDTYEAQAVLEMEALARPFVHSVTGYPFEIETTGAGTLIRLKELLSAVIRDVRSRRSFEMIAARFHRTIENIAVDVCMRARQSTGLNEVALCGSVWQNMILLDLVRKSLKREGFTVYFHRQVPVDDGGLALGQAIVANHSAGGQKDPIAAGSVPLSKVKRLP